MASSTSPEGKVGPTGVPSDSDAAARGQLSDWQLSDWLLGALEEERRALCADLDRWHQESIDAIRVELKRRHQALAVELNSKLAAHPLEAPITLAGARVSCLSPESPKLLVSAPESPDTPAPAMVGEHPLGVAVAAELPMPTPDVHSSIVSRHSSAPKLAFGDGSVDSKAAEETKRRSSRSSRPLGVMDLRISERLFQKRTPSPFKSWRSFVDSTHFELGIGIIIVLNGIMMALEVQHQGLILGHKIEYSSYESVDPWPGAKKVWWVCGVIFGSIFTVEVVLRLVVLRVAFFANGWNVFDLVVVLGWLVEALEFTQADALADTTVFRVARLARLLRLVRVVRQIRSFDALFLMTTAIQSSATVLFWSCALLLMLQVLVAFLINQVLQWGYFYDDKVDVLKRQEVFEYFGSFSRAVLSTFEMTLANWPPVCRVLMENVSEWFMILCVLHKLTVGFAVIGIINGVFIQETFRVAANDDFIMMHEKEWAMRTHRKKMAKLFEAGDESGDGNLQKKEFLALMNNAEVKMWLASMDLDAADADALFHFMDKDKDHQVSVDELIEGVSKLRGSARSLDLLLCLHRQNELYKVIFESLPAGSAARERAWHCLNTSRFRAASEPRVSVSLSDANL